MVKQILMAGCLFFACGLLTGCSSGEVPVSVVDLDKVLEITEKVLKEPNPAAAKNGGDAAAKEGDVAEVKPLDQAKENAAATKAFLTKLAAELNAAKLVDDPIGVQLLSTGAIEGFIDEDKDGQKSGANEKTLFRVEIDHAQSRLVAIDDSGQGEETYRRDRSYHHRGGGGGFFMGYMLGSMMGRQNRYYSGARAGSRPSYGSMKMNNKGYHSGAVSSARSRAKASGRSYSGRTRTGTSGARAGGSGSFRGGK